MKKEGAKKIKVLWHPRKVCAYITFCAVLGFSLSLLMVIEFSKVTRTDVWWWSVTVGMFSFFVPLACTYLFIWLKSKDKIAYINYEEKIIIKGKKKLYYTNFDTSRTTWLQKIFGLITIEFRSGSESKRIILKDVSQKILDYL